MGRLVNRERSAPGSIEHVSGPLERALSGASSEGRPFKMKNECLREFHGRRFFHNLKRTTTIVEEQEMTRDSENMSLAPGRAPRLLAAKGGHLLRRMYKNE